MNLLESFQIQIKLYLCIINSTINTMIITQDTITIEFPNGKKRHLTLGEFNYYAETNELQHKSELIIIRLDDITKSFIFELDDHDEILFKEYIGVKGIVCD